MLFDTEFENHEDVFMIKDGNIVEGYVIGISINVIGDPMKDNDYIKVHKSYIIRWLKNHSWVETSYIEKEKLYRTKEEAANEWLKLQGLQCGLKNN